MTYIRCTIGENMRVRCRFVNLKNPLYIAYHDTEWGVETHDEHYLYETFILECFQAGLSWECILNKRKYFREAYDNFDIDKVCLYDEIKINELLKNENLIRHKKKIEASINNSKIFREIQKEYSSFDKYIWSFTNGKVLYIEGDKETTNEISDKISKDLKKRGMKFVGSVTIYSYLQAIGVINAHMKECFLYTKRED